MENTYSHSILRRISQLLLFVFILLGSGFGHSLVMAEGETTVTVTEQIPGMDCSPDSKGGADPEHRKFKCTVQPGFGSVILILRGLIKYATFITALVGVLMLVVSGVQYSLAGANK